MSASAIMMTTTGDDKEELEKIAWLLIEKQLAACCQIVGPIQSIYRWQDNVEATTEWMCLIKTQHERFDAAAQLIRELHHYDEPEIIATEIVAGSQGYLDWLTNSVK
jgi:periplasmic divalent cation tolerance protein